MSAPPADLRDSHGGAPPQPSTLPADEKTHHIKTRLRHAVSASAFGPFVSVFVQLVSVPLLLKSWGAERYGEWLLLSAVPSYLSMSDFGFATAAANQMTMQVAAGNRPAAVQTFQSMLALLSSIAAVAFALAAIAARSLPVGPLLHIRSLRPAEIASVLLILSVYSLTSLHCGLMSAGFRCDGNYARGVVMQTGTRLCENLALISAVFFGSGVLKASWALLLVRLAGTVWMAIQLHRRSPWLSLGVTHASPRVIRRLFAPAVSFMAIPIGNGLSLQGTILVVGHVLGPVAATAFSTIRTLTRFGLQFTDIVKNGVWPEISVAFGKSDLALARRLYQTATQLTFWTSIAGATVLYFAGERIFHLWTHGRVGFDAKVFTILLISGVAGSSVEHEFGHPTRI